MEIKKELKENVLKISLIERLDTTTAPGLELELQEDFLLDFEELVFDFEGLDYISSAGLRVMLTAKKKMDEMGRRFKIINVKSEILEVFEVTGFTDILEIEVKKD